MKLLSLFIISVFTLICVVSFASAATEISQCTLINKPGTYTLTKDIINAPAGCIRIAASNVIFDCQGHTLQGTCSDAGISSSVGMRNLVIKNCKLDKWSFGIRYAGENGQIVDNKITNGCGKPTRLGTIQTYGIILSPRSSNNKIYRNIVDSYYYGIYSADACNNNEYISNTLTNNNNGLYLQGSSPGQNSGKATSGNLITGNTIISNSPMYTGLVLYCAKSNIIYNNVFSNSKNVFISLYCSGQNTWNKASAGNYWYAPNKQGYSQTCTDKNKNKICDVAYKLDSQNYDYYPMR